MLGRLQLPCRQTQIYTYNTCHNSTPISASLSFSCWTVSAAALLIHPALVPLISLTDTASLLHCLVHPRPSSTSTSTSTMKSVRMKSPAKASVARHDEHPEHHALDPACAICQVDVGTRSPDGVKESWSITPCGHVFGSVCIKRYLAITDKPLCPVCRTDLFHACSHPVLPATFDPRKHAPLQSRDDAAREAFPGGEPRRGDCRFCRKQRLKAARRQRRLEMLEGPSPAEAAAEAGHGSEHGSEHEHEREIESDGDSGGGGSSSSGNTDSESEEEHRTRRTKGLRWALHLAFTLARLTLDATHIRKIKALHPEDDDDEGEGGGDDDIVMADSPQLPATSSRDLPPVPGLYGYWEVAKKGPDWKFLAWFDSQEPKTKTTPEQFS